MSQHWPQASLRCKLQVLKQRSNHGLHHEVYLMKLLFSAFFLTLTLMFSPLLYAGSTSISKQQAISTAQQLNPGRVLSVKLKGSVYQVKTLSPSGDVRVISIDANTGKVLGQ